MNKKIDIKKYEGHTSDWKWFDISEQDNFYLHSEYGDIINHDTPDGKLAQDAPLILEAYNKKCNEAKWLREALQIITKDLDSAIAQGHIPIRATDEIDVTKIRNFAHDASI